jgi:hypothetical protein
MRARLGRAVWLLAYRAEERRQAAVAHGHVIVAAACRIALAAMRWVS